MELATFRQRFQGLQLAQTTNSLLRTWTRDYWNTHTDGMVFRVLVIGVAGYGDYTRLRGALDLLLAKRLPDVEILTTGGPGLPAFAACYARAHGLPLVVMLPDHERHPGDAIDKRNAFLVAEADAALFMADERYQPEVDRFGANDANEGRSGRDRLRQASPHDWIDRTSTTPPGTS